MVEIDVNEKTGFIINDPYKPVTIRDCRGMLFYTNETELPHIKQFNLPPLGKFYIDSGNFKSVSKPVTYPFLVLPDAEHSFPNTDSFAIEWGDNPHKCTINFKTGVILFDNTFKTKTLPEIFFILGHEKGHQFLLTEKYVDLYACNWMLAKGFNPLQILQAQKNTLSEKSDYRKQYLKNRMVDAGLIKANYNG